MRGDTYEGVPAVPVESSDDAGQPPACYRCGLSWTLHRHPTAPFHLVWLPRCECWRLGTYSEVRAAAERGIRTGPALFAGQDHPDNFAKRWRVVLSCVRALDSLARNHVMVPVWATLLGAARDERWTRRAYELRRLHALVEIAAELTDRGAEFLATNHPAYHDTADAAGGARHEAVEAIDDAMRGAS